MPRGEDVEIAEPADCLPVLVALFLVTLRALTFLLFFTKLPSSFGNSGAANRRQIQVIHFVRFTGRRRSTRCEPLFKVRFESEYDRFHRDRSDRNESYLPARPHSQIL